MDLNSTVKGINISRAVTNSIAKEIEADTMTLLIKLAEEIISEIKSELQNEGHVNTGELLASVGIIETGQNYVRIGSTAEQAFYIEFGRGPVRPINKKYLHFVTKDGKEIYAKYVGPVEGTGIFERVILSKAGEFSDVFVKFMNRKIESLMG